MDFQLIIAIIIGLLAAGYVIKTFVHQTTKRETDPECDDCPAGRKKAGK
ncbi:MAG: hypothetical protein QGF36_01675 [Candidatus Marinimicrobia bacterium]|jgi:hypothetical protein|nr:hypothetical protein [Candidatus Neomarinimicrobiota bacterium]MDP6852856.1 hypothetical protein [Candidatus Neomarinimicrobiota bacterium]MDP6936119.1 hypothetical protein [Candidatus Neomarinimicrobiota bacterium]